MKWFWRYRDAEAAVFHRPLVPMTLSLIVGTIWGDRMPGFHWLSVSILSISLVLLMVRLSRNCQALFLPFLIFTALGYLSIQHWSAPAIPENHISRFADGRDHLIQGVILNDPVHKPRRVETVISAASIGPAPIPTTGRLRLAAYESPEALQALLPGAHIRFRAKLKPIRSFRNPGGFDYERFMGFKGIRAAAYLRAGTLAVVADDGEGDVFRSIHKTRHTMRDLVRRLAPGDIGDLFRALILGESASVSREMRERLARIGVAHLLAISGLHIGLVAMAAFAIGRWLLSVWPALLWRGWTRHGATLVAVFPVIAYGFLAGMSPSTQRAVIIVLLVMAALWVRRRPDPVNSVFAAAFAILVFHPPSLFSVSFQLSFAAVLAILCGLPLLRSSSPSDKTICRWCFNYARASVIISILALLGTAPLVLRYFNHFSAVGILANLFLVPIIGWLVVPMGLAATLMLSVNTHLAEALAWTALKLLAFSVDRIVPIFERIPFSDCYLFTPTVPEIVAFYLVFGWAIREITFRISRRDEKPEGPKRKAALPFPRRWAAACLLLFLVVDTAWWLRERFFRPDLRITVVDVGQGSSTLVEFPGGKTMLVDGGGFYDNEIFDVGRYVVAPLLWRKRIMTVDTLVLSHAHADHLNGLLYVAEHFDVKQVYTNGMASEADTYQRFIDTLRDREVPRPRFDEIARRWEAGPATVELLYPEPAFHERDIPPSHNDASLVLRVTMDGFSILIPGDIEADGEEQLVRRSGYRLASTVLVAPHHGSRTSSTERFLDVVSPEAAVVSTGYRNTFNLPHPEVLDRYESRRIRLLRTDFDGAVTISARPGRIWINPCRTKGFGLKRLSTD